MHMRGRMLRAQQGLEGYTEKAVTTAAPYGLGSTYNKE
jgi:hypothetical protein